ncbi:HRR25 [Bugula neritina]|uniref:HRR25 n=1 Tax=Bugula neritina TaxID=10212 RepID=A0A7J7JU22_BUGNE|nr:HRR25 [Bugula neritina]
MESLGYMLVYMLKGQLPWQGLKGDDRRQKYARICECKRMTRTDELCAGLPAEFGQYLAYARALRFDEDPNYSFLKNLFDYRLKILNSEQPNTPSELDWIVKTPEKFKDIISPPDPTRSRLLISNS